MVWCITVPHGAFIARRNGLIFATGNSGFPKSLDVSKAIDKAAGAEREVVGRYQPPNGTTWNLANDEARASIGPVGHSDRAASLSITAPATDAAREWEGWGTALKPAFEPVVVARKPLSGTVAQTVLTHGTGALNIDACRIEGEPPSKPQPAGVGGVYDASDAGRSGVMSTPHTAGRWPTNVVLDEEMADELDRQSGDLKSGTLAAHHARAPKEAGILGAYGSAEGERGYGDTGGASRFFPTFRYEAKAPTSERPKVNGVAHPTVKPVDLCRWLVRLVTPQIGRAHV